MGGLDRHRPAADEIERRGETVRKHKRVKAWLRGRVPNFGDLSQVTDDLPHPRNADRFPVPRRRYDKRRRIKELGIQEEESSKLAKTKLQDFKRRSHDQDSTRDDVGKFGTHMH